MYKKQDICESLWELLIFSRDVQKLIGIGFMGQMPGRYSVEDICKVVFHNNMTVDRFLTVRFYSPLNYWEWTVVSYLKEEKKIRKKIIGKN